MDGRIKDGRDLWNKLDASGRYLLCYLIALAFLGVAKILDDSFPLWLRAVIIVGVPVGAIAIDYISRRRHCRQ